METKLLIVLLIVFTLALLTFLIMRLVKGTKTLFFKKHVIVVGLSRTGRQVALSLAKAGRKVVVISDEPAGPDTDVIVSSGGVVFSNIGFDETTLRKAGLANAATVFIATNNDDTNIKLAQFISHLKKRKYGRDPLKMMVHIADYDLKNFLSDYLDVSGQGMVDVQPFNIDDIAAQYVYDNYPPHLYLVDSTARDTEKIICVIGDNAIAKAFIIENSILSQYGDPKNLKVFLITQHAEAFLNGITRQYPHISNFLELIPIELKNDNFSSGHSWDKKFTEAVPSIDAVYFFGDKDSKLINSALHFRQFLYEKTQNIRKVPIVVCLPEETKVMNMLDEGEEASGRQSLSERFKDQIVIHLLKKYSDTCSVKRMIDASGEKEVLAKAVNYYYAIKYEFDGLLYKHFKKSGNSDFLNRLDRSMLEFKVKRGDPLAQIEQMVVDFTKAYTNNSAEKIRSVFGIDRLWNNLTDRKKESNRYQARHLDVKLFILKDLGMKSFSKEEFSMHLKYLAPIEHKRWTAEKFAFDFTYGALPATDKSLRTILKDTLKIHDQLVPFNALDDTNKEKDLNMFFLLPLLQKIKENI